MAVRCKFVRVFAWRPQGALLVVLAMGCGNGNDAPAPVPRPVSEAAVGDQAVVARVGEDVIRVAQVEQYVATHGVSPREALRALEDDALLLQEARRQGWQTADVGAQQRAEEQLFAQRVLLDIEREHPLDGPTEAEVDTYLREHLAEIVREEQRDCVQVLVQVPPGATEEQERLAQAYVERTLERMRAEGVSAVWSSQPPEYQGLRVLSQYLPPASPSTDMPDEFRRALFGLTAPGAAAEPVHTANGWHAVAVTDIHAPIAPDSPRAREVARERLVTVRRREAMTALIRTLSQRYPVSVEREHLEAILPALGEPSGPAT
ncbi:MAG: peptidylprolyl isomerase [Deltaproteobacteria bacterium]|jgi:parvulin-like peptidyl-prolyl isomerase|nr:peptidylprolyl isomerase [Deltaproteobacteria bacterium]